MSSRDELKLLREQGFRTYSWEADDPLADLFLIQAGAYPGAEENGIDYIGYNGTESVIHSFSNNGTDGFGAESSLNKDAKDNLFGVTSGGDAYGLGTLYHFDENLNESILYNFGMKGDGWDPTPHLIHDSQGNLYGTTQFGGSAGYGTVF